MQHERHAQMNASHQPVGEGQCLRSKLGTERSEVCLASFRPNANRNRKGTCETRTRSIFTQAPSVTAAHTCLPCHRLAAARSRLGSDSPLDCHSLPRRRFATSRREAKIQPHGYTQNVQLKKPSPVGEGGSRRLTDEVSFSDSL